MSVRESARSLLVWHVHSSWMESLVAGPHRYVIPVNSSRDADGRGLSGRIWPQAQEVSAEDLRDKDVDLVILQRPEEVELARHWLRREPGVDIPAVYVEHNAPRPSAADSVHPIASRNDIALVHVSDFNRLMWDNGAAPTRVITHGIADPGPYYRGDVSGDAGGAVAATTAHFSLNRFLAQWDELIEERCG